MRETRVVKLSNLKEINKYLKKGFGFSYVAGNGTNQVAVLEKYPEIMLYRGTNLGTAVFDEAVPEQPIPRLGRANLPD